ncbi:MAG TPA: hypothetical protein ENI13_01815 [candidate division CPR3 bacterium]|uniref:Uncharacterized protein n=1 Tax=candidate division CPR3 bacterium TaxID=2268181 RepID=A0A7C1SUU7_UNCC3|nr:hypothetical protein [candidate division CPR3 bacterium]
MDKQETKSDSIGIPRQINEQLIKQLKVEKLPSDVIDRLKNILLKEEDVSEAELEKALFSEDQLT